MAVSPDLPVYLNESIKSKKLAYPLYSDSKAKMIESFGVAFRLDDATVSQYLNEYKIDIERDSGEKHHHLPVPSVFIVDKDKKIFFSYVNPDYKVRLDHNDLLKEVIAMLQ